MKPDIRTTTRPEDAAEFAASSILKQLKLGKRVLFFIPGGSAIPVVLKTGNILRESPEKNLMQNLIITLTDERYGPLDHPDSNWHQLKEKGFNLPNAKLVYVLTGEDIKTTVKKWNEALERELQTADYKIGFFGMGRDGHTAGILPESPALYSKDFAHGYTNPQFSRITMTENAIEKLDEAVAWVQGENKWNVIENLSRDIPKAKQPAQILKKVPLLTIFTDYIKL